MATAAENLADKHGLFQGEPSPSGSIPNDRILRLQWLEATARCCVLEEQLEDSNRKLHSLQAWQREQQRQADDRQRFYEDLYRRQEQARIDSLIPEILDLFAAEPVQRGTAAIAKKLGHQQEGVRKAITQLVADGKLVASGTTRNRTYSRPDHNGRESFASTADETQDNPHNSRPRHTRRERAA